MDRLIEGVGVKNLRLAIPIRGKLLVMRMLVYISNFDTLVKDLEMLFSERIVAHIDVLKIT